MLNLQTATLSLVVNTTTKAELLGRAKAAIETGEQSLCDATVRDNRPTPRIYGQREPFRPDLKRKPRRIQ